LFFFLRDRDRRCLSASVIGRSLIVGLPSGAGFSVQLFPQSRQRYRDEPELLNPFLIALLLLQKGQVI